MDIHKQKPQEHKKLDAIAHEYSLQKVQIFQSLQWFWKFLIGITCLLFGWVIMAVYQFRTIKFFQNVREGNVVQLVSFGLIASGCYIVLDRFIHYLLDDWAQRQYLTLKHQGAQLRKKRSVTVVKYFIGFLYYTTTVILGYIILQRSTVLPWWLGGTGTCSNIYKNFPNQPGANIMVQILFIISFGKHFARLVLHALVTAEGNFYSYMLHHLITIFLILFAYSLNLWMGAVIILVIHDSSDLANSFVRIYIEYKNTNSIVSAIMYIIFPIIWIGTRNIIYPICCIVPLYEGYVHVISDLSQFQFNLVLVPAIFATLMLIFLEILHIVWTSALMNYIWQKIKPSKKKQQISS